MIKVVGVDYFLHLSYLGELDDDSNTETCMREQLYAQMLELDEYCGNKERPTIRNVEDGYC